MPLYGNSLIPKKTDKTKGHVLHFIFETALPLFGNTVKIACETFENQAPDPVDEGIFNNLSRSFYL